MEVMVRPCGNYSTGEMPSTAMSQSDNLRKTDYTTTARKAMAQVDNSQNIS